MTHVGTHTTKLRVVKSRYDSSPKINCDQSINLTAFNHTQVCNSITNLAAFFKNIVYYVIHFPKSQWNSK